MMLTTVGRVSFLLSLPERAVRAIAATVGGTLHETFQLALPRVVRRSRLYEATAKNLLRVTIELMGGVPPQAPVADEHGRIPVASPSARGRQRGELGSIAAFGFSPLWILAAAADVTRGSRTYLEALVGELVGEGVLPDGSRPGSVDELLGALERVWGRAPARGHPAARGRRAQAIARRDPPGRRVAPTPAELARVFDGLRETARRERTSLLEVSVGVGLAFFNSARKVGRQHLVDPYTDDLRPVRDEGFGAYARRVSRPYADAVARHFDADRATLTERGLERLRRDETDAA